MANPTAIPIHEHNAVFGKMAARPEGEPEGGRAGLQSTLVVEMIDRLKAENTAMKALLRRLVETRERWLVSKCDSDEEIGLGCKMDELHAEAKRLLEGRDG